MKPGLVVFTTGRNEFNRRQYHMVIDWLEKYGVPFDFVWAPQEDLTVPHARRFLKSKLLRSKHQLPGAVIHNYRKYSKQAAHKDVRASIAATLKQDGLKFRAADPKVDRLFQNAVWIFTGFGILTSPWLDPFDDRVVQFNRCSLLQIPRRTFEDGQRRGRNVAANYMLVERGPILGESKLARNETEMPRRLEECDPTAGAAVLQYLKKHLHTGDFSRQRALPKIADWSKTVFIPLHCAWDAQLIRFSPLFGRNYDFLKFVLDSLPEGWTAVVKPHPKGDAGLLGKTDPVYELIAKAKNAVRCDANLHQIVPKVQEVICINSSVGMEAMTYGKRVIVAGHATYAHIPTVTRPAYWSKEELAAKIGTVGQTKLKVDMEMVHRAFDFFWNRYLVPSDPQDAWRERTYAKLAEVAQG